MSATWRARSHYARAHANCLEGLLLIGGLMLLAVVAGKAQVTGPLVYVLLAARIVQSVIHLVSVSAAAVSGRPNTLGCVTTRRNS